MVQSTVLLDRLFEIGVFRFGKYRLKCGSVTPVYVDLRRVISYPDALRMLEAEVWRTMELANLKYDLVCGAPYAAVPLCTAISFAHALPMVFVRKEPKSYGTKQLLEGVYEKGDNCLLIEDVVTHGSSVIETAITLRSQGLQVTNCVVVLDRCQGAATRILKNGIQSHSVFRLKEVAAYFLNQDLITDSTYHEIMHYLEETVEAASLSVSDGWDKTNSETTEVNSFHMHSRAASLCHPVAERLWRIVQAKKTNVCVACDLFNGNDIVTLLEKIGDSICLAKLHADIVNDFNEQLGARLRAIAKEKNFLLMEDRKFADIGDVVKKQLTHGPYKPAEWADLVTVHAIAGPGVLNALKEAVPGGPSSLACLIVAEMSSEDNLIGDGYKEQSVYMAQRFRDIVAGFICQKRVCEDASFLYLTPGVHITSTSDHSGQRWRSPQTAIQEDRNDIVIIGRGIINSKDESAAAKKYKDLAWNALTVRDTVD